MSLMRPCAFYTLPHCSQSSGHLVSPHHEARTIPTQTPDRSKQGLPGLARVCDAAVPAPETRRFTRPWRTIVQR